MCGFDPAHIKQRQCRVEDRAHVIHACVENVHSINKLRISLTYGIQYLLRAGGWQRGEWNCLLDAEDTRLRGAIGTGCIDEGLCLRDGRIRFTTILADYFDKLQRAACAPRVKDNNLPALQMRCNCLCNICMRDRK